MIKINLLDSVTERDAGAVVAVERKIGSPVSKFVVMSAAVAFLLFAIVGWDVISTHMAKRDAENQIEIEKKTQAELAIVLKEQKELEQKLQNIDARIAAIKKLRSEQAGPSAVLDAMVERIAMVPGLYLESIEQTGETLILKGNSPDESAVTSFGRSLEFSGGLFTNLNIETERKEIQNQLISTKKWRSSDLQFAAPIPRTKRTRRRTRQRLKIKHRKPPRRRAERNLRKSRKISYIRSVYPIRKDSKK